VITDKFTRRSSDHELAAMAFILKMTKEGDHDVQDNVRMTKVRELSFDMESSIHNFIPLIWRAPSTTS
jgi:hypothetical protein